VTAYFIFAAIFVLLALGHYRFRKWSKVIDMTALLLFIGIAGLRYQTGYDWVVYEDYFYAIYDSTRCYQGPAMEPLYWLFNVPLSLLGLDVSVLFIVIASLNGVIFYFFCRSFGVGFAYPAAFYFSWIYLALQMGVLRQSLAVSFFLIACMAFLQRSYGRTLLAAFASLGMQFSALLYLPALAGPFILQRIWSFFPVTLFIAILVLLAAKGSMPIVLQWLLDIDIPFVGEKMKDYALMLDSPLSIGAIGYLALNIMFVCMFWWVYRDSMPSRAELLLLSPIILMIFLQTGFMNWPIFWNRMQYLAIPCQAVLLALMLKKNSGWGEAIAFVFVGLGFANLGYFLSKQLAVPYLPYQTIIVSYGTEDGRARANEYFKIHRENNIQYYEKRDASADEVRTFNNNQNSDIIDSSVETSKADGRENSLVNVHEGRKGREVCAKLSPSELFGFSDSGDVGRK